MDSRSQAIIDELKNNPQGLSFNQLCNRLKNIMARQTLHARLAELVELKLVQKVPEQPRKGQRVLYTYTKALEEIECRLNALAYIASQQERAIKNLVEEWEKGKVSDKTFFNKLIDCIIRVPQRIMGVAYILAYGYSETLVHFILPVAFQLCNGVESRIKLFLDEKGVTIKPRFKKAVFRFLQQG